MEILLFPFWVLEHRNPAVEGLQILAVTMAVLSFGFFTPSFSSLTDQTSRRRLSHAYPPKDGPQGEVIGHFECPGQDEGPSNYEQGTL
jgi:hypothetical protein